MALFVNGRSQDFQTVAMQGTVTWHVTDPELLTSGKTPLPQLLLVSRVTKDARMTISGRKRRRIFCVDKFSVPDQIGAGRINHQARTIPLIETDPQSHR